MFSGYIIILFIKTGIMKYDKLKKLINDNVLRQFFAKRENIVGILYNLLLKNINIFL